ncbi:MAG: hypothetical protein QOF64_1555, partial [Candidatus Binatota bacterium]|nr:hypothetical protein [Candidatus Binatota bacterium]
MPAYWVARIQRMRIDIVVFFHFGLVSVPANILRRTGNSYCLILNNPRKNLLSGSEVSFTAFGLAAIFQKLSNIGLPSFRGHVSLVSLEAEMTRDVVEQNKATTAEKINTESELAMDETKRAVRNAIRTTQRPRVVTARLLVL